MVWPLLPIKDGRDHPLSTVVHAVVWRNSVVWCIRGNTALWLVEKRVFCMCPVSIFGLWVSFSQSHRCISPRSSIHGISPNDSVNYSQTVLDPSHLSYSLIPATRPRFLHWNTPKLVSIQTVDVAFLNRVDNYGPGSYRCNSLHRVLWTYVNHEP